MGLVLSFKEKNQNFRGMKRKPVAAVLALTLGMWGTHRFYLGQWWRGVMHIGLFAFCFIITVEENVPMIMAPVILAIIDGVLLAVMPKEEFDYKYNRTQPWQLQAQKAYQPEYDRPSRRRKEPSLTRDRYPDNPYKRSGIEKFRQFDYQGAANDFLRALELDPNHPSISFNLACCYSLMEDVDEAIYHLDNALQHGFSDLDKIHDHSALAYIRTTPLFDEFVKAGYQMPASINTFAAPAPSAPHEGLIEQIKKLGELRDQGILTEAEFQEQKSKVIQSNR